MNKFVLTALFASSLAVSAQALIVGADAGYLTDAKEEYISARIGYELKTDTSLSHQANLEFGYTGQKEAGVKGNFYPITLNYRAETTMASKLGYYFGAGAGFAITEVSGFGNSDNGTSLAAQAFTGLSYQASPSATLHAGVKYIWIDDVKLFGSKIEVGDDIALTAGLSIKF